MATFTPSDLYEHLLYFCSDKELDQMEHWLSEVVREFHGF